MKKIIAASTVALLLAAYCAPKKSNDPEPAPVVDSTPPVITLIGELKDTVSLNDTYPEPGAIAVDNTDGNVSASIVITGVVNTNQIGDYTKRYNVKDAAGNSAVELQRSVHVKNDAAYLAGSYNAVPNCGASGGSNYSNSISVSSTVNNQITFSNLMYNSTGMVATAMVSGSNISLLPLVNGTNSFSGSGTISTNKKSITLGTSAGNSSGFFNCSTVLTKQ